MTWAVFRRGLLLIATLVAVGFAFDAADLGRYLDTAWIDADVRGAGAVGGLLFVAVGAVCTGVGLPRQMIAFLGGYAFGLVEGTGLSLAATVIGCIATFTYARLLGRDLVKNRFPARVRRVDDFLHDNPFSMTLLIRFLPLGSNLVTNLAAGVSRVGAVPFVCGSALGYVPQMVVFALLGSGIAVDPALRIGLGVVLFLVSGGLGVTLYRRYRHGKTIGEAIDRELGAAPATAVNAPEPGP